MSNGPKTAGALLRAMIPGGGAPLTSFRDLLGAAGVSVGARSPSPHAAEPAEGDRDGSDAGNAESSDVESGASTRSKSYGERLEAKLRKAEAEIDDANSPEEELTRRRKADVIRRELSVYNAGVRHGEARARAGRE